MDSSFNCYSDGQRISGFTSFNGEFICPAYDRICNNNTVGVVSHRWDEGDSGEAEDGTKTATGNRKAISPLAGGQTHQRSIQVSLSLRLYY